MYSDGPGIWRSHVAMRPGQKELRMYEPMTPLTPPGEPRPEAAEPTIWTPATFMASSEPVTPAPGVSNAGSSRVVRRPVGPGFVLSAVLASALLASGGTYLAVTAAGHPSTTPTVAGGTTTAATSTTVPVTNAGGPSSLVDIVKAVSPAVVTIEADGVSATDPATGQTGIGSAIGSGVIFDANGLVLTNHHVVEGDPSSLTVKLKDGRSFDATVYGIDTLTDLAIVKVDATGLPTAQIGDSSTVEVGQQAIAIGSPLGTFTDSVTSGIISALGRSIPVENGTVLNNLIQTDTAINPGNSGGPLLDPSGKIIGINTAGATDSQGIGFAIPIDIARPLLKQASAGQPLARPYLGIHFETIDPALKQANNLPVDDGAWIPSSDSQDLTGGAAQSQDVVVPGGPAAQAGLQAGDIITAVDGTALDATHTLEMVTSQLAPGATATLDILRDGQTTQVTVVLGTRPATM